jgi:ketosteroid isomerase-like protein
MNRYTLAKTGPGDWYLKGYGDARAVKRFSTQGEGIKFAQDMVQSRSVVIHGRDGKIREERTYPRSMDPICYKG